MSYDCVKIRNAVRRTKNKSHTHGDFPVKDVANCRLQTDLKQLEASHQNSSLSHALVEFQTHDFPH